MIIGKEEVMGFWGMRCWRSSSGMIIPYLPSLVFLANYFFAFHQLAKIAFPSRARMSSAFRWTLCIFLFSHAVDIWQKTILLVDMLVEIYLKTEPQVYHIKSLNMNILIVCTDLIKFMILLVLSVVPLIINWVVLKQQQNRHVTWFDVRRRYRTELGSSRYYLSRPCSPLEQEQKRNNIKRTQSDEIRKTSYEPLLKIKPKSA